MTKRNRLPTAIIEIIEPPKIITSPPEIGYWIDTSRIGVKPCAKIRFADYLFSSGFLASCGEAMTEYCEFAAELFYSIGSTTGDLCLFC